MTEKEFSIGGMSCIACQHKIEHKLLEADGIKQISVSYKTGKATVSFDPDTISFEQITKIIESLDYTVLPEKQSEEIDISMTIGLSAIIIALFVLLQRFGILNLLVPSRLAESGMSYGMLFVVGLLTSVHCIAMCGGINLSQCIPNNKNSDKPSLMSSLLYNLGRVISYTVIGFILGGVGMVFGNTDMGFSVFAQGIIKLVAGICMVIMGINMLGIFPVLRRFQLRLPKGVAAKIFRKKSTVSQPFIVGSLNGLMPCGPLQSMQILALASGNPFAGALSMLLFSLGTVPLMLGLGTVVSALGRKFSQAVMQVGAVLVAVMGLAMVSQGGSLSGLFTFKTLQFTIIALTVIGTLTIAPFSNKIYRTASIITAIAVFSGGIFIYSRLNKPTASNTAQIIDGVQIVRSTLSSGSYPNITVQSGVPVEWTIEAPQGSINGCNNQMIIREYDISHVFNVGENVISFTPTEAETIYYSCWMGMIQGTINVV